MTVDLTAATAFMAGHARLLDRHRFARALGEAEPVAVLDALHGYRNPNGGYGWGLEPDLRSATSQPGAALHAFEAIAEAGPATTPHGAALCDWLDSVTLPDGGLPFALAVPDPAACAPFWANADPTASSLQITAIVAATAHDAARHDAAIAGHPWLTRATDFCFAEIEATDEAPFAIALAFALRLLDAVHATRPEAPALLERLAEYVPADGIVPVAGGLEDEVMRPLDMAPRTGPVRDLFAQDVIDAELERLVAAQEDDGGWTVDFASYSPQASLEWRGYATVRAVAILRGDGLI
jgi:hypothetical protein